MPKTRTGSHQARDLELAARFLDALYVATGGRYGRHRSIADVAARAGITKAVDLERALATAEAAGFLVVRVDRTAAMLSEKGLDAARPR